MDRCRYRRWSWKRPLAEGVGTPMTNGGRELQSRFHRAINHGTRHGPGSRRRWWWTSTPVDSCTLPKRQRFDRRSRRIATRVPTVYISLIHSLLWQLQLRNSTKSGFFGAIRRWKHRKFSFPRLSLLFLDLCVTLIYHICPLRRRHQRVVLELS